MCVALCPAEGGVPAPLPAELREVLSQRRATVHPECEPLMTLAALVKHERALAAAPKGGAKGEPLLLLLVEPSRLRRVDALIAAASKYAPHAAVWTFDSTSARRLARYIAPAPAASGGNGTRVNGNGTSRPTIQVVPSGGGASGGSGGFVSWVGLPRPVTTARPRLKLTDAPTPDSGGANPAASKPSNATGSDSVPAAKPARTALTEEELSMLLGGGHGPNGTNGSGGSQR